MCYRKARTFYTHLSSHSSVGSTVVQLYRVHHAQFCVPPEPPSTRPGVHAMRPAVCSVVAKRVGVERIQTMKCEEICAECGALLRDLQAGCQLADDPECVALSGKR